MQRQQKQYTFVNCARCRAEASAESFPIYLSIELFLIICGSFGPAAERESVTSPVRTFQTPDRTTGMQIIRGLPSPNHKCDCAAVIGNFDGVHLGHQALLAAMTREAHARGLTSAVVTFEPHPRELFGKEPHARICTLRDKMIAFARCGVNRVYIMPFTRRFASLSPEQFARDILSEGLGCRWVTVGNNFHFGSRGAGDFEMLRAFGKTYGFEAVATPLLLHADERVSSSRVRKAMAAGDLVETERLLGRPYCVTGRVIHGAALGRTLGFPTLNIAMLPPGSKAVCALHGVFAVRVKGLDGDRIFGGVASLGFKPTVASDRRWLLETFVFNYSGNAYGKLVEVEFVEKLRDEKKFSGLVELKAAIDHDAATARMILAV